MTPTRGMPGKPASPGARPELAAHIKRVPFLAITASFILGILACDLLGAVAWWIILSSAGAILGIGGLLFRRARLATVGVLVGFCGAGGTLYHIQCVSLSPDHIGGILSDERVLTRVRGYVCTHPTCRQKVPLALTEAGQCEFEWETAFLVRLNAIISEAGPRPLRGRIMVKIAGENLGIRYGDELVLTGEAQLPNSPTNPAQFDYRQYLRWQGIHAILYARGRAAVEWTGRRRGFVGRAMFTVRRRLIGLVNSASEDTGGKVLAAMLLGARDQLPPHLTERFKQSGTMHLLAISGLHVGIIAGSVWLLTSLVGAPERLRNLVILLCVACYVILTGARPPAVRAGVMIALIAIGGVFSRRQVTINSLAIAAFIILVFSPGQVFMVGFQLSFIAVLSIIYFYRPIRRMLDKLKGPLEDLQAPEERSHLLRAWIAGKKMAFPVVAVSLAASIGVLPLIAHTFNIVSVVGILCNAVLVPLATVVVWLGIGGLAPALVLSPIWPGAVVTLKPAAAAAGVLASVADGAARLPFSYFYTGGPPAWFLVAYYALLVVLVHRRGLHLTPRRCAALVLVVLNVLAISAVWPDQRQLKVTCFDVRHGGCTFFQLPSGKTLLYDCGTVSRFFDVGAYLVAPVLWERGIHTIDALVLSHADRDHINGVDSLIKSFKIGCVVHPPTFGEEEGGALLLKRIDERRIHRIELAARQAITLGDTVLEALNPPALSVLQTGSDPNNQSLVMRVASSGKRFLLCADIRTPAVAWLLASGQDLRADVIFMPHHGSLYSNTEDLLQAVGPQAAVISCDRGYAEEALLGMLRTSGIRALQTPETGAIEMTAQDGELKINTFLRGRSSSQGSQSGRTIRPPPRGVREQP